MRARPRAAAARRPPPGGGGDDEADEARRIVKHDASDPNAAHYELEYAHGTKCDLSGQQRATSVQLLCGGADAIVSVVEDHTCHYRLVVTTPHLCKHPMFVHSAPSATTVTCRPRQ